MNLLSSMLRTNKAAERHRKAENDTRKFFIERYGVDFSDVNCDPVIDICSGQGDMIFSIEVLDKLVKEYCNIAPVI